MHLDVMRYESSILAMRDKAGDSCRPIPPSPLSPLPNRLGDKLAEHLSDKMRGEAGHSRGEGGGDYKESRSASTKSGKAVSFASRTGRRGGGVSGGPNKYLGRGKRPRPGAGAGSMAGPSAAAAPRGGDDRGRRHAGPRSGAAPAGRRGGGVPRGGRGDCLQKLVSQLSGAAGPPGRVQSPDSRVQTPPELFR